MAAKKELTPLDKKGCVSSFKIKGNAIIRDNTFTIDAHSQKTDSDWIFNRMSLGVDCGPEYGVVFVNAMSGYGRNRNNVVYAHGYSADEPTKEDWNNQVLIDWDDRGDTRWTKELPDSNFYTASIETDTEGKRITKKFLTQYDFIEYLSHTLVDGQDYIFSGDLSYNIFNDNVQQSKDVRSVTIANESDDRKYATFIQTVLVGPDAVMEKNKEKQTVTIGGYVLKKMKSYNGHDLTENGKIKGGQLVPLHYQFEMDVINPKDKKDRSGLIKKLFMNKNGYNQITFCGKFFSGGKVVDVTYDDLDENIKELVDMDAISLEEALADCADGNSREYKNIWVKIRISKKTDEEGNVIPTPGLILNKYDLEDINDLYYLVPAAKEDKGGYEETYNPLLDNTDVHDNKKNKEKKEEKEESKSDDDFDINDLFDEDE